VFQHGVAVSRGRDRDRAGEASGGVEEIDLFIDRFKSAAGASGGVEEIDLFIDRFKWLIEIFD
jgi:hypothetical protein